MTLSDDVAQLARSVVFLISLKRSACCPIELAPLRRSRGAFFARDKLSFVAFSRTRFFNTKCLIYFFLFLVGLYSVDFAHAGRRKLFAGGQLVCSDGNILPELGPGVGTVFIAGEARIVLYRATNQGPPSFVRAFSSSCQ